MSKFSVKLDREQRRGLEQLIRSGQAPARKLMHARILLKADSGEDGPNWPDTQISEALEVSVPTIWRVRRRFVEQGLEDTLNRRPQPERPNKRIFDGEKEAHLIALTCGDKPEGEGRWSLRLLAERLVKLGEVEQVSYETVRRVLKKTSSSRGSKSNGALPPKPMPTLSLIWKMCSPSMSARMTRAFRRYAWMRSANNS
jgi:transposase